MAIAPLPHLPSYRQLLATADIRMLLLTTLLSRLAGRMFALTIVLYGVTQVGSTELAGWLAFAAVAPGLLISPIAGSLIDSLGSAWAITVDLATSAVFAAALAAAAMVGCTNAAVLLALTGCFSLTSPLSFAGIRALLPRLVSQAALDRANALDTAINGLTDVAGPALAGLMVGLGRPSVALGMIAVIYAAASVCIGQVRADARFAATPWAVAEPGMARVAARPWPANAARTGIVLCAVRGLLGHAHCDCAGVRGATFRGRPGSNGCRSALGRPRPCGRDPPRWLRAIYARRVASGG